MLRSCIHCGLCLNQCPTYRLSADEAESPRGRLLLMADLLRDAALLHDRGPLDRCLGCLGCETACPSGVRYGELLAQARCELGSGGSLRELLLRWIVDELLPRPRLLTLASWLARPLRTILGRMQLPSPVDGVLGTLPQRRAHWPRRPSAASEGGIAVLPGCAQWVFTPEVLDATLRLVRHVGEQPFVPAGVGCCGALSHHQGSVERSRALARRTVETLAGAEVVLIPSAGCSAHMRHYGALLAEDPGLAERAQDVARRCVDVVVWLAERRDRLVLRDTGGRVAYHPPCHHWHAQGIQEAPYQLLSGFPALELVPVAGQQLCCGSAGSHSLTQPEQARELRSEKLSSLLAGRPQRILTANPGCELFLDQGLRELGSELRVEHLLVFLADRLEDPASESPFRAPSA
jgi:glycolate oxidase iron-sulfur subunit